MQSIRQSELFASKDWLVLYQAFTTVNFNSSDPASINSSLRDYLANNYPEDFNDWIESSEFVAIIDLLSWLAGTLAFKTDINARENFLETAEARESILRLARFLSYNPRRNRPASGLVKIVEVSTDDDITDSTGANLAGVRVQWNNADDPDWFERFTTIMSSAFVNTNPFGTPLKAQTIAGTRTQLYRVNCLMGKNNLAFGTSVGGEAMDFELCNGDFSDGGSFSERTPDINAAFNMFYRNDGNGNGSSRTGFFMLFKQGSTIKEVFRIDQPVENLLLDLGAAGVNENDVWVQTIGDAGQVLLDWKKVPAVFSDNITYNSIPADQRDIYSVITRDDDQISLRFSDGIFGSAPVGTLRCWHRVSNGKQYQIRPTDINRVTQVFRYYNAAGVARNLRVVFSLQETVSNATPRETDEQIRQRAPGTYAAQNRMVSGEDYNTFPLSSNLATKLKAVNRVYSGHSRFVDLNDPTSTYTDVVVTADDGMLYRETANLYEEVSLSLNRTPEELTNSHLQGFLRNLNVKSYVINEILTRIAINAEVPHIEFSKNTTWNQVSTAKFSASGWLSHRNLYLRVGTQLQFRLPNGDIKWATIASLNSLSPTQQPDPGIRGPVTLSEDIPTGSKVTKVVPGFSPELPVTMFQSIADRFANGTGFSLWFDPEQSLFSLSNDEFDLTNEFAPRDGPIHVCNVRYYAGAMWKFAGRGSKFVFESARKVKWYFGGERVVDGETGAKRNDSLTILRSNNDLRPVTNRTLTDTDINSMDINALKDYLKAMRNTVLEADGGLGQDRVFNISKLYYYGDGSQEPRRVQIDFTDVDSDGYPDDPESYSVIADLPVQQGMLFWRMGTTFGQTGYKPLYNVNVFTQNYDGTADTIPLNIRMKQNADLTEHKVAISPKDIVYMAFDDTFWQRVNESYIRLSRRDFRIAFGRGRNTAKRYMVLNEEQIDDDHDGIPNDANGDSRLRFVTMYSTSENEVASQKLPGEYIIRDGSLAFKWKHFAPASHRIDPAITNIVDIFLLTTEYDYAIRLWIANGSKMEELPVPPTELDLRLTMQEFEDYKMFSDEIVWRPVTYKLLFGPGSADQNLRAKFKVIKLANSSLADGEIKARLIDAVNRFFDVSRWDFGETFYFTELAAYIHQSLAGIVGSVVIVPLDEEASFGDNFEVRARSDEIFISTAQVSDVEIINANTSANLRIR
jgi:hypothetical protein